MFEEYNRMASTDVYSTYYMHCIGELYCRYIFHFIHFEARLTNHLIKHYYATLSTLQYNSTL